MTMLTQDHSTRVEEKKQTLDLVESSKQIDTEIQDIWQKVLEEISKNMRRPSFETWIKPTVLTKFDNNFAVIAVKNEFTRNFLMQSYAELIQKAIKEVTATSYGLRFIIDNSILIETPNTEQAPQQQTLANLEPKVAKIPRIDRSKVNKKLDFSSYVTDKFNQAPVTFAKALIENSTGFYSALYVFSESGLGKTHLLHAIANETLKEEKDTRIKYLNSEEFTNELIIAIQRNETAKFRTQYRNVDLLLVDDFHFMDGKKSCCDELAYTIETIINNGGRVVFAANKALSEFKKISPKLLGMLKGSLISEIKRPGFSARIDILRKKAELANIDLKASHLDTIARKYEQNIRELESALLQLTAFQNFSEQNIDDQLVADLFGAIACDSKLRGLSIDKIIEAVADYFAITAKEIKSKRRIQEFTKARHIAIYLAEKHLKISYSRIGEAFSGRKHSSIIHSLKTVQAELNSNLPSAKGLAHIIEEIELQF